ncbi:4141_t:CDS:2, partial [Cetraspora pellucida]
MDFFAIFCTLTVILFIYYLYSSISFCFYLYNYKHKNQEFGDRYNNQNIFNTLNDSINSKSHITNSTAFMENQINEVKFRKNLQNANNEKKFSKKRPNNKVIKDEKKIKPIYEKEDAKEKWNILDVKFENKILKAFIFYTDPYEPIVHGTFGANRFEVLYMSAIQMIKSLLLGFFAEVINGGREFGHPNYNG